MRKIIKSEKGSVSVFLIVITLVLFIFNAILIDFARVYAAQLQTEKAAEAGVRSVLSHYNYVLQGFGLYGFYPNPNNPSPDQIFEEALKNNLSINHTPDSYTIVDTKMEDYTVKLSREFKDLKYLENQILEQMKYRAPIEFTGEIVEQIISIAKAMKEVSHFTDYAKQVDEVAKEREKALDNVKDYLKSAKQTTESNVFMGGIEGKGSKSKNFTINTIQDIHDKWPHYRDAYEAQDEDESSSGLDPEDYFNHSKNLLDNISTRNADVKDSIDKAKAELDKAIQANTKMKKIIEDGEKEEKDYYDRVGNQAKKKKNLSGLTENLNEAREASQKLIYGDELQQLMDKINNFNPSYQDMTQNLSDFKMNHFEIKENNKKKSMELLANPSHYDDLQRDIKITKETFEEYKKRVNSPYTFIHSNWRSGVEEVKNVKEDVKEAVKGDKDAIKDMLKFSVGLSGDIWTYDELEKIIHGDGIEPMLDMENELEDMVDGLMGFMDEMFSDLDNFFYNSRDRLYVNEYILMHFKSEEPNLTGEPDDIVNNAIFKNREVEYITYGIHEPFINYGSALTQLASTRLGLNFLSGFFTAQVKAAPHPMAKVLLALQYAINETKKEMERFTDGNKTNNDVPLLHMKGMEAITFDYHDYLRLFLFMNPNSTEKRLERIKAVVEFKVRDLYKFYTGQENGFKMDDTSTYVTGTVNASVKLWFLPGIAKLLSKTGFWEGNMTDDNRFKISKTVHSSY